MGPESQKSPSSGQSIPCALWPVDLKLTHLDWNPEATLIHFQGQYLTICELDYSILQGEIQNTPKTKAVVDIGEFCLVEDLTSARWYRGRVQNCKEDQFDVFLIDYGNVLSVNIAHISSCSSDLFILPPKIVCGFLANVLLLQGCSCSVVEEYLTVLIGQSVTGYIQAFLPHKVLLLEATDINDDLVRHGLGRHVDTETFLLLVEMLTEVPLKQNIEPVPDLLIEKPRGQEFSFKPCGLKVHKQILSFCGPRLPFGTRAKVHVTAGVSLGLFYCQMTSKETEVWEMSRKLAEVCEYTTKQHQKTPENLGLLCSAKRKDGKWYRGFVQYLPVNSLVRVFFIDYGFFESVKVENIHSLPPESYSTPIMAFPCSLSCLSDQDEALKTQQLDFLQAGLLGKVLDVDIKGFDEEKELYSITIISAEEIHVKKPQLIQEVPQTNVKSAVGTKEAPPQSVFLSYETIMSQALDNAKKEEKVQVGSEFVGYVEYAQDPNNFWIRTQKRNDEFEEMMKKMIDHFSHVKLKEDVLEDPEVGTMCCAVYEEDMHFYRGVVTDTLEHGSEVLFIDFGNIEKVPHMLIKKIPETFASKSAFAFCCTLANVLPMNEVWTCTSTAFFRGAVSNKALLVHVVRVGEKKFVVDLKEVGSESSQTITELMIASNQAEYWKNIPIKPELQKCTDKTHIPGHDVTADVNGWSEQWKEVEDEDQEKTSTEEPDKVQTPASFKALNIKSGSDFAVRCTHISSPSEFWCQPLDKVKDFEKLMDKMQQYYSTHTIPFQPEHSCCVAMSSKDGRCFRTFVTEIQDPHIKVTLVDYGSTTVVKRHNLQAIIPEFAELEGLAFRCSLYNVIEPADPKNSGYWSPEVLNVMKDFVQNSTSALRCMVVSQLNVKNKGLFNVVDLYNGQTKQSLTKLLLERGLAREVTISAKQLSTVFPESFTQSSFQLTPGNEELVYITHVSSHCKVYGHLEKNTEDIERLEQKISEESDKMIQASTKAVVSKLCLAKFLDGRWYRGLIQPVQSPLHLNVFFVDYGNTKISEKDHVMFIPRNSVELLYTPVQAVTFCLASVSKEETYAEVKEWLDVAILNKQVRVIIVGKNDDGSFDVQLFDGDVNLNEKVNELILSLAPKPVPVFSFDADSIKRYQKKLETKRKSIVKGKWQPKRQSSSSPICTANRRAQVETKTLKNTGQPKNTRGKNKTKKSKQESGANTKSNVAVDPQKTNQLKEHQVNFHTNPEAKCSQVREDTKTPQLSCLPDMKVSAGLEVKCFVSHIDSVHSFFLQLSEDEPAILKMVEDLNSSVLRSSLKSATSVSISDLVLAEYEEDGALYRATVKDHEGSSCLKVEFVDYGNSAVISKEKTYSIPKEYLSIARFGIPCSLLDTNMYQNVEDFTEAVMEKPLMVGFISQSGTQWKVRIEILEEGLGLSAAPEAADASSAKIEKEVEAHESTSEIEERMKSDEQDNSMTAVTHIEAATLEKTMPGNGENFTSDPSTGTLLQKVKVIISRYQTRRPTRKRGKSKKSKKNSPKAECDEEDAIEPLKIQAEDTEDATILSVLSGGRFYIRLNRTREQLAALQNCIADNPQKCKVVPKKDLKIDFRCLVQVDKDMQWHRAVVQKVGEGTCQVLLVDQGVTEQISNGAIQKISDNLRIIQDFAVLCKVNCLGFSDEESADKLWCENFQLLIGKDVRLVFVSYSEAEKLWMVEIFVKGLRLIHQTLLRQNEAIQTYPETRNETEDENLHLDLDTSHLKKLTFAPVDIDKAYSGFAAAVTTPLEFCIVLEDLLLIMNKVSIMLDDLPEQMPHLSEAHLAPGTCCLIKSESKNKWCRAEIVNIDATVVLNLVDYGHCECMPCEDLSKLRMIPGEIRKLPKMTYPCILRGVKPIKEGQWTDEAVVFFQKCLYQKNLQIFFREFVSNTHWKVDILADGVHVAKEMVDAGHASFIDTMLGLRFQEQSLCKAASHHPVCEDERLQDEASGQRSDLSVQSSDEGEKMALNMVSGSRQCLLM